MRLDSTPNRPSATRSVTLLVTSCLALAVPPIASGDATWPSTDQTRGCDCRTEQNHVIDTDGSDHPSHVLLGVADAEAEACCAACGRNATCHSWTYSATLRTCWLDDNNRDGEHRIGPDLVSGFCHDGQSPPIPPLPPLTTIPVEVTLGHVVASAATPEFLSFTLDWWGPDEGCHPSGWGPKANVIELDLESSRLRSAVSALSPAVLRIGGSLDKDVRYAVPGSGLTWNSSDCPERLCLNASRWDALHDFARETGVRIVFGLSYPVVGNSDSGVWNDSQAEALLRYSASRGYDSSTTMLGFELGEELTRYEVGTPAFAAYTRAYHTAAALLREVWPSWPSANLEATADDSVPASPARPLLMGPCPGMSWPQLATWMPAFLRDTAGALDVVVYHSYNQIVPNPPRTLYLNATCPGGIPDEQHGASPGGTGWQAEAMAGYARDAGGLPLWLGEGGPHNGGGGGPYSSTFLDSFYYADALGFLAARNHSVFARQTLVGGNYELLRCSGGQIDGAGCDLEPNPDYWVALLWRRLVGRRALRVTTMIPEGDADTSDLRVYAHCAVRHTDTTTTASVSVAAPGAVTIVWTNMNDGGRSFLLGTDGLGRRRIEWTLSAANTTEGFASRRVSLNGSPEPLVMGGAEGAELPTMPPRVAVAGMPLEAAPRTLGFALFPYAGYPPCL